MTRTTTLYEDVSSINITTFSEGQSLAFSVLTAIDPEYEANGFALNNGTNAFVDGSFSVAYPTPFIGIQGFEFISVTQQDPSCPKGLQSAGENLGTTDCACMMQTYMDNPDLLSYTTTSQITLSSTYYELGDTHPVSNDLGSEMEGPIPINNVSYSNFIESVLGSEGFNKYRSCAFLAVGVGPPALMIPVSALTATTTATVKSAGNYGVQSPQPASSVTPILPPPTSTPTASPSVPLGVATPNKVPPPDTSTAPYVPPQTAATAVNPPVPIVDKPSPLQVSASSPANQPGKTEPVQSPSDSSSTGQTGSKDGQNAVGSSDDSGSDDSNAVTQPAAGTPSDSHNSGVSDAGGAKSSPVAAIAIQYADSTITPDTSSYYSIPQVGKLSPGGSPVTTNNIVYSLAPSATALVSNGQTISLPTYAAAAPDTNKQLANPALTFAGSTYTADSSSRILIAGQTLKPGGPAITVSSTPISLAPDASLAVVGGTTQSLLHPTAVPSPSPVLTFAGSTYTPNSDSAFLIQGQTHLPGTPAITVSTTPISLAPGADVAVIAGQTQSLSPLAAVAAAAPVLTFAGSAYTADAAKVFTIDGQTLIPGGTPITVSHAPISLAPGATFALVAGSTLPLLSGYYHPTAGCVYLQRRDIYRRVGLESRVPHRWSDAHKGRRRDCGGD